MNAEWAVRLFNKSVLKQRKYKEITDLLGSTDNRTCLDIGSDNGVISYLLRERGGTWTSADLDAHSVDAIRALIGTEVYQISDSSLPFEENTFDCTVIVDFLEHIEDDAGFLRRLHRTLTPGGTLIINVPHIKNGPLRWLRHALGQTDEKHGHLRPGYTLEKLTDILGDRFVVERHSTYSKFFSELIDTLIVFAVTVLRGDAGAESKKGLLVTGDDLRKYQSMFRTYSLIYPVVSFFSKLDSLLFFTSGYMLIVKARVNPKPAPTTDAAGDILHMEEGVSS